jgi:hypothetical protein
MAGTIYNMTPAREQREAMTSMLPDSIRKVLDVVMPQEQIPMPAAVEIGPSLIQALRPLVGSVGLMKKAAPTLAKEIDIRQPSAAAEAFSKFLDGQQLEPHNLATLTAASKVTGKVPPADSIIPRLTRSKVINQHTRSPVELPKDMAPMARPASLEARRAAEQAIAQQNRYKRVGNVHMKSKYHDFVASIGEQDKAGILKMASKGTSKAEIMRKYGIKNSDWAGRLIEELKIRSSR